MVAVGSDFEAVISLDLLKSVIHSGVADLLNLATVLAYQVVVRHFTHNFIHFATCAHIGAGNEMLRREKFEGTIDSSTVERRRFFKHSTIYLIGCAVALPSTYRLNNQLALRCDAKTALAQCVVEIRFGVGHGRLAL